MTATHEIRTLEECAINAWPALRTVTMDGWLLRLSGGRSKRVNPVNALDPGSSLHEVRTFAETLYARHGLPTMFRISPLVPEAVDAALQGAGYPPLETRSVMTAPLQATNDAGRTQVEETLSPEWLNGFAHAAGIEKVAMPVHGAMIAAVALPVAYATAYENGEAIGFGRAVFDRCSVGLFDLAVAHTHRGRGHGRSALHALLAWGSRLGAARAYLQVRRENETACRLYASAGFAEAYRYSYRIAPGWQTQVS